MPRIAVGGFLHETNTFAPTKAAYADFVHGGGWPSMMHGADVLKVIRNINVGLAGFIGEAEAHGWELVPTIFAAAGPCAHVTKDAYERIARVLVDGIAKEGIAAMEVCEVSPPYDISDITSLMGVRLMMDVVGTMAKNGRIGGRLKI